MKPVHVDTDNSELSASTASNTTLPHLKLPMPKKLSMTMREEGRRQESSKEKQERRRSSNG